MERSKRAATSRSERTAMLEFLRILKNFALLTGQATKGKPMKRGEKLTRSHGLARLAEYVNAVVLAVRPWNTQNAKSRYISIYGAGRARVVMACLTRTSKRVHI
ncbi:hypothetical protein H257_16697 [Aphanomyces astaci]|uniref:Uncharacterized protein n=1 Tax=Aphanomyces astaci TaxID=112090 RepID=W4FJI9_APHAT|nr:hypothetical protein H257_16697 [Aphanomyces astaci]ETV67006.1 hypothetical protein H257_16697 [Aphanomyces astaci]|eukprot:XP_009843523.1 hypothetical protein H257_16697 [Aphanomyces astaci]